jgi:outer membrane protein OmpA-like peptidoglycan-associated protein/tetratricopeptide (TPR) repeat protein
LLPQIKYKILIIWLFAGVSAFAQEKKATRYFEQGYFSRAARLYEEVLQKDSTDRLAINNLAHCYRAEKKYRMAEVMFRKTLSFSEPFSLNRFHHAEMVYLLGDYARAEQLFQEFLFVMPNHKEAQRLIQACEEVSFLALNQHFEVVTLRSINSPFADFSPVIFKNGLVFTTERKHDSGEEEFAIEDKPFLSIYHSEFSNSQKTSFWQPKLFSAKLNTTFHDGPACFTGSGNKVYFTRVQPGNGNGQMLHQMQIFISEAQGEKWSNPVACPLNNKQYGVGHPAIEPNEKFIIFSSNMAGGEGGMDLYISYNQSNSWSEPHNLGPAVNTPGDEVFPTLYNNSLYFSSSGLPGFGGLDLFVIHLDSLQTKPRNLLKPVNSAWDDLSITFLNEHKAYFSSDRPGGMGRDDIYGLERKVASDEHRAISGLLEYREKPAANATVSLLDANGKELQRAVTSENGIFLFEYLKSESAYRLDLGVKDEGQLRDFNVFLLNSNQQKVKKIVPNNSGNFVFELLKPDDHDNLPLLDMEDRSLLAIDIKGQVYESNPGDFMERVEIVLIDNNGKIISRTFTDIDGQFIFSNIFPDDQYIFRLAIDNPNLKIVIRDMYGNILQTIVRTGDDFVYTRLTPDDETISLMNEYDVEIKVKMNENIIIPNIYYDFDRWELNEVAKFQLNKLVLILKKNPHIKIRVISHTDSRASELYNQNLSSKRANTVVDFIRGAGIDANRITGIGMGEQKLVNGCKDEIDCLEVEHAQNRRTEFEISTR